MKRLTLVGGNSSCQFLPVIRNYRCLKILGQGSFGQVYKAYDEEKKEVVAVKKMKVTDGLSSMAMINEVNMLKEVTKAGCKAVAICYRDFFEENGDGYLVTDFVEGITLEKYMARHWVYPPKPNNLVYVMYNLAFALQAIHSIGLAHNDVQPRNIMVDSIEGIQNYIPDEYRFIDFGFACVEQCSPRGRFGYMSPEKLNALGRGRKRSLAEAKKSDIYALGAILFQLANQSLPHSPIEHDNRQNVIPWITAVETYAGGSNYSHPASSPQLSACINGIIEACISRDPNQRPPIDELVDFLETLADIVQAGGNHALLPRL